MRTANLLLLIALVAAGAPNRVAAQTPQRSVLQQLTGDISAQLDLRYPGAGGEKQARRDRLSEAIELWNESQKSDADAQVMERWLLDALRASMAGSKQPMPALPRFAYKSLAMAPTAQPLAAQPNTEQPLAAQLNTEQPLAADPAPRPRLNGPVTGLAPSLPTPTPADRPDASAPFERPEIVRPEIARPEIARPQIARPQIAQSPHPAAARIAWSDPFRDDPFQDDPIAFHQAPLEQALVRETRLKPELPPRPGSIEPRGRVDLRELSARVRGLSQGLSSIEARLNDGRPPSAFELAGLVRDLEQLSSEDRFLRLYLNGLRPAEAREVGHGPDLAQTISLLDDRVERRQEELDESQGDRSVAERDILTALVVKLDELRDANR